MPPTQLSLGVSLRDDATFSSFFLGDEGNTLVVRALTAVAVGEETSSHVIWGAPGSGLSHLLQAVCHRAHQLDRPIQYLPMRDIMGYAADDICEGLEHAAIVCVDGIDLICGNRDWETALFHLFNRMRDAGTTMLMSSHTSPPSLPILLRDLKSRVLGSVVFHIKSLDDAEKQQALIMRAHLRGMAMSDEVARFILSRAPRDMNNLFLLLNHLDEASIQQQRKLTIPFVKEALNL